MPSAPADGGYPTPITPKGLDIPPRTRLIILLFGFVGIVLIVTESLVGNQWGTIQTDKIIHFTGYAVLAGIMVTALPPRFLVPVLLAIVAMGWVIEFLQPKTGRTFDTADATANMLGVAIGALVGLVIRNVYSYLRKDIALKAASHRLFRVEADAVIARQGEPIKELLIIKSGRVRLWRDEDGEPREVATLGGGELIGALGAIRDEPYYLTVEATKPTLLYRITLEELTALAGGPDQPLSMVIIGLAKTLRTAGELLVEHGKDK